MRHAAIAIGSNSTRSLVADKTGNTYQPVLRGREETRLFLDLDDQGCISPAGRAAVARAVQRLYAQALSSGARDCALFATSACRDAKNGGELEADIFALTGLRLRIISGEEEARLSFLASAGQNRRVVLDVGGGSTEMTLGEKGVIKSAFSAQMGASRLLKMQRIASMDDAKKALETARAVLSPFAGAILQAGRAPALIGLGGSCTTAASIQAGRELHGEDADGAQVTLAEMRRQLQLLSPLGLEERVRVPGLPASRAAIMPHGLCILIAALELLGFARMEVSGKNNLDGYILSLPEA